MIVKRISGPTFECNTKLGYIAKSSKNGRSLLRAVVELDCGCLIDIIADIYVSIRHVECSESCVEHHTQRTLESYLVPRFLGARTTSNRQIYWHKLINRILLMRDE